MPIEPERRKGPDLHPCGACGQGVAFAEPGQVAYCAACREAAGSVRTVQPEPAGAPVVETPRQHGKSAVRDDAKRRAERAFTTLTDHMGAAVTARDAVAERVHLSAAAEAADALASALRGMVLLAGGAAVQPDATHTLNRAQRRRLAQVAGLPVGALSRMSHAERTAPR